MKRKYIYKKKAGFSLIEVLSVMAIAMLLTPAALMIALKVVALLELGTNRNKVNSQIREFDQRMEAILKQCSPNLRPINFFALQVEYYHKDTGEWTIGEFKSIRREGDRQDMVFFPDTMNEPNTYEVIAEGVYIISDRNLAGDLIDYSSGDVALFPAFEVSPYSGALLVDFKFGTDLVQDMVKKKGGYRIESGVRFIEHYYPSCNRPMQKLVSD